MFYTQLKQQILPVVVPQRNMENAFLNSSANFTCGLIAGILASLVTHPADVIKTKMQLKPAEYRSVHETILKVLSTQGAQGLVVGLAPRMLRRTLMSALAWTVYEQVMRQMGLK